jgi:hypothetical protein
MKECKLKTGFTIAGLFLTCMIQAQVTWHNVDSLYQPLPPSVHVFKTTEQIEGKPNIAFYIKIPLKDRKLTFDTDTTLNRRITPSEYYNRNNKPLVVVNSTFFLQNNSNANLVVDHRKMVSVNIPSFYSRSDSVYYYTSRSAIGIDRKGRADVAWIFTDSLRKRPYQIKTGPLICSGRKAKTSLAEVRKNCLSGREEVIKPWKMVTAVGGGPTLISDGTIHITNNEEKMFTGRAINDRHPRTAMGYTENGELIILVVQGRFPGLAEGVTLGQEAQILKELGCVEALNLDGGGSSCLLINGKETITPCDKTGQRPVPAVFLVRNK